MKRPLVALGLAVVLLVLAPAAALAATRYASPDGSPSPGCPAAAPCPLAEAITGAAGGDTVRLGPGTYEVPATIEAPAPISIIGSFVPTPVWDGPATQAEIVGAPGVTPIASAFRLSARWLTVRAYGAGVSALQATGAGSVFDHLYLAAIGGSAVALRPSTAFRLTESVAWVVGPEAAGVFVQGTASGAATLRNDTLVARGAGSTGLALYATDAAAGASIQAINTIASGETDASAGGVAGSSASIAFDHSNLDTTSGAVTSTNGEVGDPKFADETTGDFYPLYGSPVINAGIDDPANGKTDLAGSPRRAIQIGCYEPAQITHTDIGAYEAIRPAPPCPPPPPPVHARIRAKVHGSAATIRFRVWSTDPDLHYAVRCRLNGSPWSRRCPSPASYRDLAPGRHRFSLQVTWNHGKSLFQPGKVFFVPRPPAHDVSSTGRSLIGGSPPA